MKTEQFLMTYEQAKQLIIKLYPSLDEVLRDRVARELSQLRITTQANVNGSRISVGIPNVNEVCENIKLISDSLDRTQ